MNKCRLILGLARSGKTKRVIDEIRGIVHKAPADACVRGLLVVPEQYSHGAERQLLKACGDRLSLSAEVLSFTRLASRVFEEAGAPASFLSGGGRLLTLYRALAATQNELSIYGGAVPRAEFLTPIADTVRELKNSCVTPENLLEAAGGKNASGALRNKLRDLALLLAAADAVCGQIGAVDNADAVTRLADMITDTKYARADIYFDGFNDFTQPEFRVIAALIRGGADLTFCLTCDGLDGADGVFAPVRETARRIISECNKYNREVEIIKLGGGAEFYAPCREIALLSAEDTFAECEYAAHIALSLAREGYRWGDIAVMSRDMRAYGRLCERVMERYGIPVFRAGRDDILQKPPVRFVFAALDVLLSGWETSAVIAYIKTGLTNLTHNECDRLENYAIKWSIRARQWARSAPWVFGDDGDAEADELRRRLTAPLSALSRTFKSARSCGDKLRALYAFLEDVNLAETLENRAEDLRSRGFARAADEYRQLWDALVSAFDEMVLAAGEYPAGDADFVKLLSLVLSQYDVGVIPVALDRVTLGEFTRARRRDIRALIVLGATDEHMPPAYDAPGVLSRAERDTAINKLGLPLTDGAEALAAREMNTIYSTLTLPGERLYIITPETARPSFIVQAIAKANGVSPRVIPPEEYLTGAPTPYREYLAINGGGTPPSPPAPLSAASVTALFGEKLRLSATRAEKWNRCRYAFFLENGLRAKVRGPVALDAPASGTFIHYVLEYVTRKVMGNGGFTEVTDDFVRAAAREGAKKYAEERMTGLDSLSERFRYLFNRLARDTERVALDMARELRRSDFTPIAFEAGFETDVTDSLLVSGIIDRVDQWTSGGKTYLRVSDYKSGGKSFVLSDTYYGLNMQMILYLCALTEGARLYNVPPGFAPSREHVPSAALYIPARDVYVEAPRNATDAVIEAKITKELCRSGLLLMDDEIIDALERGEKRYLPVKITSGKYAAKSGSELLPQTHIGKLARFVMSRMREISDGIRAGSVAPNPYYRSTDDNACQYCNYSAACPFGTSPRDAARIVRKLSSDEFWSEIEGGADDE